jgi:hypothetical protein
MGNITLSLASDSFGRSVSSFHVDSSGTCTRNVDCTPPPQFHLFEELGHYTLNVSGINC